MKCKINGFWNSNGTGEDQESKRSFSWNNFMFCVSYSDKKQAHMVGVKSKFIKVKASDLNHLCGFGLSDDAVLNITAEWLEENYNFLGSTCLIEFDDDSNLIDFEMLTPGSGSCPVSSGSQQSTKK